MKIVKFGGSSLATGTSVEQALKIILSDTERQVVVVSAPGKRSNDDIKVTDLLIKYANATLNQEDPQEIVRQIFARYQEIGQYFGLNKQELTTIQSILLNLPKKKHTPTTVT